MIYTKHVECFVPFKNPFIRLCTSEDDDEAGSSASSLQASKPSPCQGLQSDTVAPVPSSIQPVKKQLDAQAR